MHLVDQVRDEGGPSGLVRGAQADTRVPVKVLIEEESVLK